MLLTFHTALILTHTFRVSEARYVDYLHFSLQLQCLSTHEHTPCFFYESEKVKEIVTKRLFSRFAYENTLGMAAVTRDSIVIVIFHALETCSIFLTLSLSLFLSIPRS